MSLLDVSVNFKTVRSLFKRYVEQGLSKDEAFARLAPGIREQITSSKLTYVWENVERRCAQQAARTSKRWKK